MQVRTGSSCLGRLSPSLIRKKENNNFQGKHLLYLSKRPEWAALAFRAPRACQASPSTRHMVSAGDAQVSAAIRCARELLAAWTVAQYLDERRAGSGAQHGRFKKSAICVDPSDTLGGILSTLARHDILSAPVVEKTSGRYSGFVDVAGILSIFVKSCRHWLCREYGSGMVRRLALSIPSLLLDVPRSLTDGSGNHESSVSASLQLVCDSLSA